MTKFIAMIAALVVMMFAASPHVAIANELPMKTKCYLKENCEFLVGKVLFPTYCEKLGAKSMKPIDAEGDVCKNIGTSDIMEKDDAESIGNILAK